MRKKNKLGASSRIRRAIYERNKTQVKERFCKSVKQITKGGVTTIDDRSLNLAIQNIPYLEINNEARSQHELTLSKLKSILQFLDLNFSGKSVANDLLLISEKLNEIGKETNSSWFIGEINFEEVLIFYHEYEYLNSWFAPRLKFLTALKKRSLNWFNTVVNSFQQLTSNLHISDSTDVVWSLEWLEERIYEYETEEEQAEAMELLESYRNGKPRKYLNLVKKAPIMGIDECIGRLKKFPIDLLELAMSIIDLLELCKEGKSLIDYDMRYCSGLNDSVYDEHASMEMMFSWIYDYDEVCDMTEEYIQCEVDNSYQQPPSNWMILGENFTLPKSINKLKEELNSFKDDDWPGRFEKCMDNLCSQINNAFPYKK